MLESSDLFPGLKFNPKKHSYTLNKVKLKSVTQYLSKLKESVNWTEKAQNTAEKNGVTVASVLKEWEQKRNQGAEKGTNTHAYIEDRLNGFSGNIQNGWIPEMTAWENFWNNEKKYLTPMAVELRVGDKDIGLGGTIDCLMYDNRTKKYHIYDWKTGVRFEVKNDWGRTLLPPLDNLDDCHYVNYSLQLCIYHLIMLKNTNLPMGIPSIVRLTSEGEYFHYNAQNFLKQLKNLLLTDF